MSKELVKNWETATQAIANRFVAKYFGKTSYSEWISDEIGGCISIGDYYFSLDRMIETLKYNATRKKLFEYYDYELGRGMVDKKPEINFKNFVKYGFISSSSS